MTPGIDSDDFRRQREDDQVQVRKAEKEAQLEAKRRQLATDNNFTSGGSQPSTSNFSANFANGNGGLQNGSGNGSTAASSGNGGAAMLTAGAGNNINLRSPKINHIYVFSETEVNLHKPTY